MDSQIGSPWHSNIFCHVFSEFAKGYMGTGSDFQLNSGNRNSEKENSVYIKVIYIHNHSVAGKVPLHSSSHISLHLHIFRPGAWRPTTRVTPGLTSAIKLAKFQRAEAQYFKTFAGDDSHRPNFSTFFHYYYTWIFSYFFSVIWKPLEEQPFISFRIFSF